MIAPVIRRRIIEPAWAAWSSTPRLRAWHELERTQFSSPAELRDRQEARLRQLVATACRDTRFYAERFAQAGIKPDTIRRLEDLRRLPVLTKHEVRTRLADLCSRAFAQGELLQFRTGGSTGVPLILYITEDVSERRNAAARRSDRWSGWEVGEMVAAAWGNPELPRTVKEKLRSLLLNPVLYLDTMEITPDAVREFARRWRVVRPTLLFGHAHSLYVLARMAAELGIDEIRPKGIISTSMMLIANERAVIERTFGVKATDRYGCEEVGLIGCECERHSGMHINVDHLVVEFLRDDGSQAPAGEAAHVVLTDLLNHAMPLIRYRIEDMASWRDDGCPCGRTLPMMGPVAGRVADFLLRRDGARVAGISLIENSLTKFPGIEQMQIVQEELSRILIRVVPAGDVSAVPREALVGYFEATFPGATIDVQLVDLLKQEPNGKYRFSICTVTP
jgi:phenylacetate-CoA ligase